MKKSSDKEVLGCIFLTIITNFAPILISLVAHLLWGNRFTLFLFWTFVILGLVLMAFAFIGLVAVYDINKEVQNDNSK